MIRKKGHYIVDSTLGKESYAYCIKCSSQFCSPGRVAIDGKVFDKTCKGDWTGHLESLELRMTQVAKELAELRECMVSDARMGWKGRKK